MKLRFARCVGRSASLLVVCLWALPALAQTPPGAPLAASAAPPAPPPATAAVYRCPGPPVLYTDAVTPREAQERGCRLLEGAPVTVLQAPRPRPAAAAASASPAPNGNAAAKPLPEAKVDVNAQRQRDRDARRILETELKREEDKLAEQKREFNGGEPERRAEERNYQTYIDRVAQMRAAMARSEADIAALKRELTKLAP